MRNIFATTAIATLLSATALPALAQDVGVDAGAGVSVEAPAADAAVDATVDATADTYDSVTASIAGSATADLSSVTEETQVTIVLLSSLEGDAAAGGTALDEALSANAEGMTTLQGNIDSNPTIKAKLEAEGHMPSDVVAVKTNADGSVTVYVDDRA